MRTPKISFALVLAFAVSGCATFQEALARGMEHYHADRFQEAMAVWIEIEPTAVEQPRRVRGEYHTYTGLTHLRLGHRRDARHHLALARQFWGALPIDTRETIERAERELGPR